MLMMKLHGLLMLSIVNMSFPIQTITFDNLNDCEGSHSD